MQYMEDISNMSLSFSLLFSFIPRNITKNFRYYPDFFLPLLSQLFV